MTDDAKPLTREERESMIAVLDTLRCITNNGAQRGLRRRAPALVRPKWSVAQSKAEITADQ